VRFPKPEVDAPPLAFLESELLGYMVFTLDQAEKVARDLQAAVSEARA
jgi:hypothetical protein